MDEADRIRRPVRLFLPVDDLGGNHPPGHPLEKELLVQPGDLVARLKVVAELHHPGVQERESTLHGVRHQHPVPLRGDQVRGKERGHLEELRLAQTVP